MTRLILITATFFVMAMTTTASASPAQIYDDCQDGRLDRSYSQSDYRKALSGMPGDLDEYTNCRELIRSAMQGIRGGGGSGPGGAGEGGYGALPAGEGGLPLGPDSKPIDPVGIATPEERADVEKARASRPADLDKVSVAGVGVKPGDDHSSSLPTPLIVLLALTALGALTALVPRVRDLVLRRPTA